MSASPSQRHRSATPGVWLCVALVGLGALLVGLLLVAGGAEEWLGLLADSFLVALVPPWHSNRSKRLIKSPKLYFLDVGLAAWLAGWRTADQLRNGPQAGALLETYALGALLSAFHHRALDARVSFWRDRDGHEVDFVVEARGRVIPIEVKVGTPSALPRMKTIGEPEWGPGWVVSLAQAPGVVSAVSPEWNMVAMNDIVPRVLGLD